MNKIKHLATHLHFFFIFPFIVILLTACGLGGENITLPEKRPTGTIEGNILGGLYANGTMTAYSLDNMGKKQYLAHAEISEHGSFHLTFSAPSQSVLLEAAGGSYLDPRQLNLVSPAPDFLLNQIIYYSSGQEHTSSLTPTTHFSAGLMLYWLNSQLSHLDESQITRANKIFSDLFGNTSTGTTTSLRYEKNTQSIFIENNNAHGLLITGLAQIAYEERKNRNDALTLNFSLSSLVSILYEDIHSDGLFNGESIFNDSQEIKQLAFGEQIINASFYRLTIAFAQNKSLKNTITKNTSQSVLIESFLSIAQNNSELLSTLDSQALIDSKPIIQFTIDKNLAKKATFNFSFAIDNAFNLDEIQLFLDDKPFIYPTTSLTQKPGNFFSLPINTENHSDGIHNIKITVTNHLGTKGSGNLNYVFDNTAPQLSIKSGNLTNTSQFELMGSYFDEHSRVAQLTIDNEVIELTPDAKWKKEVLLSSGHNEFLIKIEDVIGNATQIRAHVLYDEFAPTITLTSSTLTNTSQFELQGEFIEGESNIKKITINGSPAGIIADSRWSKLVSLNRGNNEFIIGIEDEAGNKASFPTRVILDDLPPEVSISSANLINSVSFLLEGEYRERDFGGNEILVNGKPANRQDNNRWSIPVILSNGENIFTITLKDELNNQATFQTSVTLDRSAPTITLTSKALSNTEQFVLSGTYMDGESGVKQILVNDISSTLINDQQWEIPVTLALGNNTFTVRTEDVAENTSEFTTDVFFDNTPPLISITSSNKAATQNFLIAGDYAEAESGIRNIMVNAQEANILNDNQWSVSIELQRGENNIIIAIEDKAGNHTEISQRIDLDDQAPIIQHTPTLTRFSNNNGTYFIEKFELIDSPPLFIELNQLSLSGMAPSESNLKKANIPYLSFNIKDQAATGLETKRSDLAISYQYIINDTVIIPWLATSINMLDGSLQIPLTTERLSNAWYQALPSDTHTVKIRAIDTFNNTNIVSSIFQTHLFSTELTVTVDDSEKTIATGDYATRGDYINNEFIATSYKITNPHDYAMKIKVDDNSQHSIDQEYDEVTRENQVQLKSTEHWQVATLTGSKLLGITCPEFDANSWENINHLFNYMNNEWVKIFPEITTGDIESVKTDAPPPPKDEEWAHFLTNDTEIFTMLHVASNEKRLYYMDYLRDYDVPGSIANAINNPGFVDAWHYKLSDTDIEGPCPAVSGVRTKTQFEYQPVNGYPKNTTQNKTLTSVFNSSHFEFFNENLEQINEENGWYELPAKQTVSLNKYINTYELTLHDDELVKTPEAITAYGPHSLNKKTTWTIDRDLIIETQFDPSGQLDSQSNIRHQALDIELNIIEFTPD